MKFSSLLFPSLFAYVIRQVTEERLTWMEKRNPHPYDICLKLIELESKGYDLKENRQVQMFLFKCAHKYGLERQDVAMRLSNTLIEAARRRQRPQ